MAQVVEALVRQARGPQHASKVAVDVAGLQRGPDAGREDEPSLHPQVLCVIAFVRLAASVLVEGAYSELRQCDHAATLRRLDIHELQAAFSAAMISQP